ncbi:MAG: hypothetical protein M3O71_21200 [Bacteroidota bacterium]|nr:hypothetical protein [Bacteroidota bacterium]
MLVEKKANNPYFQTTSNLTKEELTGLYGELLPGDLILKFAEHKNFVQARAAFRELDEPTIAEIDRHLSDQHQHARQHYKSRDEFLAVSFLKLLVSEWHTQRRHSQYRTDLGYNL